MPARILRSHDCGVRVRQIVDRIGAILALYSFEQPEWGVSEIGARLGLPKSSVSELLASLAAQGIVERTPRGRYRLGWRLFELNHVLLESKPLVREARRGMQELVERHGESSHLMVLDRHQAVIVEKVQATLATQILMSRVGLRLPPGPQPCRKIGIGDRQDGSGQQRGIDRPRLADRQCAHRDARRHLHDRQQRILPGQRG